MTLSLVNFSDDGTLADISIAKFLKKKLAVATVISFKGVEQVTLDFLNACFSDLKATIGLDA